MYFKGLRGLRHLKKLKYLRLEGLDHVKDLAKSALLLEEAIPGLIILGVDFEHALKGLEKEMKILENERVVLDAKGIAAFYNKWILAFSVMRKVRVEIFYRLEDDRNTGSKKPYFCFFLAKKFCKNRMKIAVIGDF